MDKINNGLNGTVNEIKRFIIDNNIVGTSAGVCIALAAKDGIQSLVGDIIIPAIVLTLKTMNINFLTKYLPVAGKVQLNLVDFVKQMITFILIIIISFVFVKFAFGYLLGINYTKSTNASAETKPTNSSVQTKPTNSSAESTKHGVAASNTKEYFTYNMPIHQR
jgi:large-conductance mechanosensitive channel